MAMIRLNSGEKILAQAKAQLAKGFPQTAGDFFLTSQRLVLDPDQFASMFFGRRWEEPLSRVVSVKRLGSFEGGTLIGGAGKKLAVTLDDSTQHTFAFYFSSNIDEFYDALMRQLNEGKG
jgi:hypothetical protein